MYCPECRTEYREGFNECADCGAALVAELPPESELSESEYQEYETVLTTGYGHVLALAQSVLDSANIPYFVQGDDLQVLSIPAAIPCEVQVPSGFSEEARTLLADIEHGPAEGTNDENLDDDLELPNDRTESADTGEEK